MGNSVAKLSLLADDTLVFLNGEESSFASHFCSLAAFEKVSGLAVNLSKCQSFFIGSKRGVSVKYFCDNGLKWPKDKISYLGVNIPIQNDKPKLLFDMNFNISLEKIATLVNIWSVRNLSLLGRVTIIKSLLIPTLLYKLSVIPTQVPANFIKKLKRIIYKFLWGSSWERVRRETMICSINEGGVNMIEISAYLTSLRMKYVKNIVDKNYPSPWKTIETSAVSDTVLLCALYATCNLESKLIRKLIPFRTLRSSIEAWKTFAKYSLKVTDVPSQPLWLNKLIKHKREPMFIEVFAQCGVTNYFHLLKNNTEFYSFDEIAALHNITPNNLQFINFINLLAAVPMQWVTTIRECGPLFTPNIEYLCELVLKFAGTTKTAYQYVADSLRENPIKAQVKWINATGVTSLSQSQWHKIYKRYKACTKDTKLLSFQIKLNLYAVVTNVWLFKFGIKLTDQCDFCNNSCETLIHLFCDCSVFAQFWENICSWMSAKIRLNIHLNKFEKIFGVSCIYPAINNIILCAKFFMYRSKIQSIDLSFPLFLNFLKIVISNERIIAYKCQNMLYFKTKWLDFMS